MEPLNIPIPRDDDHLTPGCTLPFWRSQRGFARTDAERAINVQSSSIDLSGIYGASAVRNVELQEYDRFGNTTGRLKVSDDRENLLPRNENGLFNAPDTSSDFFLAGDYRANQHPALAAMHTLFVREHNSLARFVANAMPTLEKNLVYEFARQLNIAKFQKIVYEEFYPAIAGRSGQLSTYQGPRPNVNPTVSDIFAGAALRVWHTMVGSSIPRAGRGLSMLRSIPAREIFFKRADDFTNTEMENVLRGIARMVAQEVDVRIVDTLRNQLFENIPLVDGYDLISLNIQRGRDHNLPKFNEIRELFGLRIVSNFGDIRCDSGTRRRLRAAYEDVDDIEALPGLLAESHMPGSSLGETILAVWKEEFERQRWGPVFLSEPRQVREIIP
eukprot:GFKZ01011359.1.p1 GENE.GFKZ01011359.1~~GFKZ01011359.1.p1  ORF type:complete len:386 (-),score=43.07 GFKZ01011359.1:218-1375(-)